MTESLVLPESFEVQSGRVDSKWAEFGLHQVDIKLRDRETGYKLIVRNSEPLAITSRGYVLIPNEVALQAADAAAQRLGAKPFTEFSGPWFAKPENHVMMNHEQTRMSALYAFDEGVEIAPGDKIHVGFSVRNGIDGGAAFGTGAFTFRHACANMFLMARLGVGRGMNFDDREVMSSLYQIHFGKPAELMATVDELVTVLEKVVQNGFQVVTRLRTMTETKLSEEKAAKLRALPVKYLEKISGFDVSKKAGKKAEVQFVGGDVTEYQAWNDITQLLTHDVKGGWDTKMMQYAVAQQVFFGAD